MTVPDPRAVIEEALLDVSAFVPFSGDALTHERKEHALAALASLKREREALRGTLHDIRVWCEPVVIGGSYNEDGARMRIAKIASLARAALDGEQETGT